MSQKPYFKIWRYYTQQILFKLVVGNGEQQSEFHTIYRPKKGSLTVKREQVVRVDYQKEKGKKLVFKYKFGYLKNQVENMVVVK